MARTFMAIIVFAIVLIGANLATTNSYGQDNTLGCDTILIMQLEQIEISDRVRSAALNIMTKESFDSAKKSASLSAKLPIKKIPIEGFADYSSFNEARNKEAKESRYNFDRDTSIGIIRSILSDAQAKAWSDCKTNEAASKDKQSAGFHIWPINIAPTQVTIQMRWNTPEGVTKKMKLQDVDLIGSDPKQLVKLKSSRKEWDINQGYSLTLKRNPKKDMSLTINFDIGRGHIYIPAVPPVEVKPLDTRKRYYLNPRQCRTFQIVARPGVPTGSLESSSTNDHWLRLISYGPQGGVSYCFYTFELDQEVSKVIVGHDGITVDRSPQGPGTGLGSAIYLFIPNDSPEIGYTNWITPNPGVAGALWPLGWQANYGTRTAQAAQQVIPLSKSTKQLTLAAAVLDHWYGGSQDVVTATFQGLYLEIE